MGYADRTLPGHRTGFNIPICYPVRCFEQV